MRLVLSDKKLLKIYEGKKQKITNQYSLMNMIISNILNKWSLSLEYKIGLTFGNQSMQFTKLADLKKKTGYDDFKKMQKKYLEKSS